MTDRILGVLGGMGPLAGAQFMLRLTLLTPAERDADHIPAVLWSDPRVPDRTRGRGVPEADPLPWLLRGIAGLAAAGCGAIAVACNTAHEWYPEMQAAAPGPVLHIVDATMEAMVRAGIPPGPVGLMGTAATLRMRLYQDRLEPRGWDCLIPPPEEMDRLVTPAIARVKANRPDAAFPPLAEAARGLVRRGARAVVLGCTEIPLAMAAGPAAEIGVPLVDSIDALALAAIAWARG
jgi:aspartate racemase